MAWGILKFSKDSQRKGFGIHSGDIFVVGRISGILEKTGEILNCRFLGNCICYEYDFFTIRLKNFRAKFFGVKFCNITQKGQIWNMSRMGSYYIAYERKFYEDSKCIKNIFLLCNMTPLWPNTRILAFITWKLDKSYLFIFFGIFS